MSAYPNIPIKEWALEDRPREKLLQRGLQSLTDAELIAILLGTGTKECSAIDLARHILHEIGDLKDLARCGVKELVKIKGIGNAKAINVVSAFELGRRKNSEVRQEVKVTSSQEVADYISPKLRDLDQEVFYVLFLNRNNIVKGEKLVFQGGVSSTIIDPKIVFREAVQNLASAIILIHNHPSGNLKPSRSDIDTTQKLVEGGKIFDIPVIDHVIISHKGHFSFADDGLI